MIMENVLLQIQSRMHLLNVSSTLAEDVVSFSTSLYTISLIRNRNSLHYHMSLSYFQKLEAASFEQKMKPPFLKKI